MLGSGNSGTAASNSAPMLMVSFYAMKMATAQFPVFFAQRASCPFPNALKAAVDSRPQSCNLVSMRAITILNYWIAAIFLVAVGGCAADPAPPQTVSPAQPPLRALLITGGHEHDIGFYSIFDS